MAALIRPKLWGRKKPPASAQINWSHPLSRGLSFYFPLTEGGGQPRNLVRPTPTNGAQGVVNWGADGLYLPSSGATANPPFTWAAAGWNTPAEPITWFVECMALGTQASYAAPLCKTHNNNTGSPFIDYAINYNATSGKTAVATQCNGTYTEVDFTAVASGRRVQIAGTYNNVNVVAYVNGISVASASGSGPIGYDTSATGDLILGDQQGTGSHNRFIGVIYQAALWHRALTPDELQWLAAEPYIMLQPQAPAQRYWVSVAAGAAGMWLPQPVRSFRGSPARQARGRQAVVVPAQIPVPPTIPSWTHPAAERRLWQLQPKGKQVFPVQPQIPVPPTIPSATHPAGRRWTPPARGRRTLPTQSQIAVPPTIPGNRSPAARRVVAYLRGRRAFPVQPQIPVPPTIPTVTLPKGRRLAGLVKGRKYEPPWGQQAAPVNPAIVLPARPPRKLAAALRRGRQAMPVPPQVPVPVKTPAAGVPGSRGRQLFGQPRGRRTTIYQVLVGIPKGLAGLVSPSARSGQSSPTESHAGMVAPSEKSAGFFQFFLGQYNGGTYGQNSYGQGSGAASGAQTAVVAPSEKAGDA